MLGVNRYWGHSHLIWSTIHQTPSIITGERDEATGMLMKNNEVSTKSYRPALPFQEIKHYKAVWDNSLNLKNGWLKAVIGYQQNRRQD
jgi:iron complex outermembrane receptor protein